MDTCFAKEGEYIAGVIAEETLYNLNEVGSLIWNLIDGQTPVSRIVDAFCAEFEITPEEAEKDTLEFLGGPGSGRNRATGGLAGILRDQWEPLH